MLLILNIKESKKITDTYNFYILCREKWTALHYAAKYGSKDCLSVLATLANTIQDLNDQTFVTGYVMKHVDIQ